LGLVLEDWDGNCGSRHWKRQLLTIGLRSFLSRAYPTMKKNNPYTPIMLREAAGTQPKVYARYGELGPPQQRERAAI
jgi:hypothetical protein